jgi:hypothetical protein
MRSTLERTNIGHLTDGLDLLAERIHSKCERAKHKHGEIYVVVDDEGEVYAQGHNGPLDAALRRNPSWLVAVYSHAHQHLRECAPSVKQIAEDLRERRRELAVAA